MHKCRNVSPHSINYASNAVILLEHQGSQFAQAIQLKYILIALDHNNRHASYVV